jgi:hypothetical protein
VPVCRGACPWCQRKGARAAVRICRQKEVALAGEIPFQRPWC